MIDFYLYTNYNKKREAVKVFADKNHLTENHYGKTKMINSYISLEQKNREQQGLEEREVESTLNTDLYSVGYFEGIIGLEPSQPEQHSYWSGYQIGCREYWAKKLSVEIPTQF